MTRREAAGTQDEDSGGCTRKPAPSVSWADAGSWVIDPAAGTGKRETPPGLRLAPGSFTLRLTAGKDRATGRTSRIDQLKPGVLVYMYTTVIQVMAPWYVPPDEQFAEGYGRLPMMWDGVRCAPPELGETIVELFPEGGA